MERIEINNVTQLDYSKIDLINDKAQVDEIIVDLEDTKGIKSVVLDRLDKNVKIHITGPLKAEKYKKKRYRDRSTFPIKRIRQVIRKMEAIESRIDSNWSDLQKAYFVYETLASNLTLNREFLGDLNEESQSLATMATGTGVCAGISNIYYEMMNRLGIKCDYIRGIAENEKHAWNVLHIDGKQYGVDLTWEVDIRERYNKDSILFFGNDTEFAKNHVPDEDEPSYELSFLKKEDILYLRHSISAPTTYNRIKRHDNTEFVLGKLGSEKTDEGVIYKYAQAEIFDDKLGDTNILYSENDVEMLDSMGKKVFYEYLLSKERIENNLQNGSNYLGFIENSHDKYRKVKNEVMEKYCKNKSVTYKREDNSSIALSDTEKGFKLKEINNYETADFMMVFGEPTLKSSVIYTKDNLLEEKSLKEQDFIANELLSRFNIDYSQKKMGGYVGNTKTMLGRRVVKYDKKTASRMIEIEQKKIA